MAGSIARNLKPTVPTHRPSRRNGRFMVSQDAGGRWIVSDQRRLAGGIFADRAAAIHFAMAECNYNLRDVCAAPEGTVLSLDALFDRDRPALRHRKLG